MIYYSSYYIHNINEYLLDHNVGSVDKLVKVPDIDKFKLELDKILYKISDYRRAIDYITGNMTLNDIVDYHINRLADNYEDMLKRILNRPIEDILRRMEKSKWYEK